MLGGNSVFLESDAEPPFFTLTDGHRNLRGVGVLVSFHAWMHPCLMLSKHLSPHVHRSLCRARSWPRPGRSGSFLVPTQSSLPRPSGPCFLIWMSPCFALYLNSRVLV